MRVGVLGPLEVIVGSGTLQSIQGAKERLLLGILAAEANRTVSVDRLVELLWDGAPPATSVRTLQSHVVRLRTALEPDRARGSAGRYVVRRGAGYALAVARHELDAVQFTDAVARGRARLVSGLPGDARDEIAGALALWRGTPYADWPDAAFAETERRRLAEVKVTAVEGRIDADLALGKHSELIPELEQLVVEQPLHEGWWSRLILALYRAGRQGDALGAARRARTVLADELGIDPGPELIQLEEAILVHDSGLSGTPMPNQLRKPSPQVCPYKGLAAYQREDASLFHGRTMLVRALVAALVDSPLLLISGPSGAGKSSVVQAGLLPALFTGALPGSGHWTPEIITPGSDPVETLTPLLYRDAPSPTVLVVDQFEELWTAGAEPVERRAYLDTLLGLLDDRAIHRLIITVRADHLGHLSEHGGLTQRTSREVILVPPLSEVELRDVVQGPAETALLHVEPELVEVIVGDVLGQPGALPLLSTALVATWERRRGSVLTLAGYLEAGGVDGALARSAESTYTSLDAEAQQRVQPLLVRMAGQGEQGVPVRRRAGREELGLDGPDGEPRSRAIDAFVDRRLLAVDENTYQVAHEALFSAWPRLAVWLADDAAGRAIRSHLVPAASEWDARERPDDELYRGSRLAAALEWRSTSDPDLTEVEGDFLEASDAHADAELRAARHRAAREAAGRRRTQWLAAALGVALLGSIVTGAVAIDQRADAQREAHVATARGLASAAMANIDIDPELSTLLALEATETARGLDSTVTRETEETLRRALLSHRLVKTFPQGHMGLAISSDGTKLATTSSDRSATVWDLETEREVLVLDEHDASVNAVAFSPDDLLIATASADGTARVWDATNGFLQHVLKHNSPVSRVVFSPDGHFLATDGDGTVRVWDLSAGSELMTLTGDVGPSYTPAYSPDGSRLASSALNGTAQVWDLITGDAAVVLRGHQRAVMDVAYSSDGSAIATASADGTARLWDAKTGEPLRSYAGGAALHAVSLSPDDSRIAAAVAGGVIQVWDTETGQELVSLAGHRGDVTDVAFAPDGDHLLTSATDGTTRVWDISVGGRREWLTVPGAELIHSGVRFNPDGRWFATLSEPSGVTIWDASSGDEVITLTGHEGMLSAVAWSPDGMRLGASSELDIPVWDVRTGELLFSLTGHEAGIGGLAFSPDSTRIATASWDGTVRIWDALTGDAEHTLTPDGRLVAAIAFTPDGQYIVTGDNRGDLAAWDAATLRPVRTLRGHQDVVSSLAVGPEGLLVTGSMDTTAMIWDVASGEPVALRGHRSFVNGVAISPDGTRVATAGDDTTVKLWDAATGRELLTLETHNKLVSDLDFSPDGRLLATASTDGTVAVHLVHLDDLVEVARERVTRNLTDEECRQYLRLDRCDTTTAS